MVKKETMKRVKSSMLDSRLDQISLNCIGIQSTFKDELYIGLGRLLGMTKLEE